MCTFLGANASRSLLRIVARRVAPGAHDAVALRWVSCSTPALLPNRSFTSAHGKPRIGTPSFICAPRCHRRTLFSRVIRQYEELPRDYRDQIGLAFRDKDLSAEEVRKIFGETLDVASANRLLRIIHGRRVAGTLDDPAFAIHTARYSDTQVNKALEYLREKVKVDEILSAGLRAEDELAELEQQQQQQQSQETAAETTQDEGKETKEQDIKTTGNIFYKPDPVYGRSSMDEIRARNRAKRKQREREEEERKAAERLREESRPQSKQLVQVEEGQRQITNPKVAEYYRQAKSDIQEAPHMSFRERVFPSAVMVLMVIGFCVSVSMVYEEPNAKYRLLPGISTAQATVGTMIAMNLVVWVGWRFPPLWRVFNKYMLFVVGIPKPVTLFTAPFSHQQLTHLLTNMVPFWVIGTALHDDIGRANLITLYLSCGAIGFLGTLTVYSAAGMLGIYTLGASGANMGLLAAYFWLHRDDGFRFFGLPENGVHGIVFLALLAGTQIARIGTIWSQTNRIDIVSHITGIVAGMGGMELLRRYSGYSVRGYSEHTVGKKLVKELWWGDLIERRDAGDDTQKDKEGSTKRRS